MCYTYDELDRVTGSSRRTLEDYTLSSESFSYDAAGNLVGSAYVYGTNNRLSAFNGASVRFGAKG
jgi:hypothetical protein